MSFSSRSIACAMATCASVSWIAGDARGDDASSEDINRKLIELAGSGARDCGSVALSENAKAAMECARRAQADKEPFRISIQVQGIDSFIWLGGARDSYGTEWAAVYDSDSSGGSRTGHITSARSCTKLRLAENIINCDDD